MADTKIQKTIEFMFNNYSYLIKLPESLKI